MKRMEGSGEGMKSREKEENKKDGNLDTKDKWKKGRKNKC